MRALVLASVLFLVAGPVVAATASSPGTAASSDKDNMPDQASKSGQKAKPAVKSKQGAALNAAAKKADNLKGPIIPQGDRIAN